VDFARLPLYGTGNAPSSPTQMANEVNLIAQYFAKGRKYRYGIAPYPMPEQASTWSHWNVGVSGMSGKFRAVLGQPPVSGTPLIQRSASYVLGFTGGSTDNLSAGGYRAYSPNGQILTWHKPGDFGVADRVAKVGMHFIHCSYYWDWNLPDSMMRSLITPPDYGLAVMWGSGDWRIEPLVLGETLGAVLLHNVQALTGFRQDAWVPGEDWPGAAGETDQVWRAVVGDPTLRLRYLLPPSGLTKSESMLQWTSSPDPGISYYYVYKKDAASGTYVRCSTITQPVYFPHGQEPPLTICSATLGSADLGATSYSVRATKNVTTPLGVYSELSQGAVYPP
jgi:hypothetical protein